MTTSPMSTRKRDTKFHEKLVGKEGINYATNSSQFVMTTPKKSIVSSNFSLTLLVDSSSRPWIQLKEL